MATCEHVWSAEKREQIKELVEYIQKNKNLSQDCTLTINNDELNLLKIALEYLNDNFEDATHRHIGTDGTHFSDVTYPCVPEKWQITWLLKQLTPKEQACKADTKSHTH